jgi:hypothetical protein
MYKLTIELDWASDETLTIHSHDFEKIQIIQEFIEFQQENGWAVDYEAVDNSADDTEEEEIMVVGLTSDEE